MDLTERHITRYTIDDNVRSGARPYNPGLVLHIERLGIRTEQWRITNTDRVYNHHTRQWESDREFRHALDKRPYLTSLTEAVTAANDLIAQLRTEFSNP